MKRNSYHLVLLVAGLVAACCRLPAQEPANLLLQQVKAKLDKVSDYEASGELRTNIPFLKVPASQVKVFFKRPAKLKIINEKGISLVPKGVAGISPGHLLTGAYQVLDAGLDSINGIPVRVIKLLPVGRNSDIVLSTLYINEKSLLVLRADITTRENGTNELELFYGKYAAYALPDRIIFSFNAHDYKLPGGLSFDYDDGSGKKKPEAALKDQRGNISISYSTYIINQGIPDKVFE